MNQEVERLQELLARVRRNAALPRTLISASMPEPSAPVHDTPPVAYAAPAYTAPATEFTAEQVFFESEPPPPPAAQTSAPLDASVDELLLEDPFPSVRPGPSYSDVLEEEPIPLVNVASPHALDAEEDVSGVMSISELSDEQPEELLEDDIVEMTASEAELSSVNDSLDELSFDDDDDLADKRSAPLSDAEPPASSSRSKIAGTMDEALARAAEQIQLEEGREIPLKTPPPESGPQAAVALPAGMHAPLSPDIEELLEADIVPSGVQATAPTTEQLGQTIDLEDARGPSLELDQPAPFIPEGLQEDLVNEELEVTLPGREFAGVYQDDLMLPPEARQELEAHQQRLNEDSVAPPPESLAQYPGPQPEAALGGFAPAIAPASVTTDSYSEGVSTVTVDAPSNVDFAPELLARPDRGPTSVAKFIRNEVPRPKTFMELLDSSLSLGSD
ncbi:MAG TPA: hypothetical protein VER04_21100 [Polyangiaceae bacterium]|nr:hypothetical protein [Polyangiaceae bacterium]